MSCLKCVTIWGFVMLRKYYFFQNLMGMPNLNFQPPLNDRAIRNSGHEIGAVDPHQGRTNPEPHSFYAKKNEEQIPSFKIKVIILYMGYYRLRVLPPK